MITGKFLLTLEFMGLCTFKSIFNEQLKFMRLVIFTLMFCKFCLNVNEWSY